MPSAFDDPTQPPHYRPPLDYPVAVIEPYTVLLKDGETTATIYPISSPEQLPVGLLAFLCDEFNMEIERGDTYPFFDTLHIDTFQNYWFGAFAAVMLIGDDPSIQPGRQWEKECLGSFYIKPNYPGRCSHICNAGFLVNAGIRGKGIGRTLAECYLEWAPRLGYTYSVFNLVFETNIASRRIWESLSFKRIGRIKSAGILKGHDLPVDAIIYGRELVPTVDTSVGSFRFDKIKFYLETGRYPPMSDRQEKSRLRSSATHYTLENGKLYLKGREVISDPARQLEIATEMHLVSHGGINKTTSAITERYHWTRIKDTAAAAIRNCPTCRDPNKHQPQPLKSLASGSNHRDSDAVPTNSEADTGHSRASNGPAGEPGRHQGEHDEHDEAAAAVAAAAAAQQLQDNLDLSGIDPDDPNSLLAAVEAAQRSQEQMEMHRDFSFGQKNEGNGEQNDIPVDPQVAGFDEHLHDGEKQPHEHDQHSHGSHEPHPGNHEHGSLGMGGTQGVQVGVPEKHNREDASDDEIEIARALIQANESDNMFG